MESCVVIMQNNDLILRRDAVMVVRDSCCDLAYPSENDELVAEINSIPAFPVDAGKISKICALINEYITKHRVFCEECIYQIDRFQVDAIYLTAELCTIMGFVECDQDE